MGVLPEDASESLKAAATAENNGIIGLNASLAAEAKNLVKNALGEMEAPANGVVVTTYGYIDVVEYVPEKSYTVKITPRFAINGKDGAEIAVGVIQNDWLSAPIEVKLTVPGEITLIWQRPISVKRVQMVAASISSLAASRDKLCSLMQMNFALLRLSTIVEQHGLHSL